MVILILALIIFGPGKLPDVGHALGKAFREFKKAALPPPPPPEKPLPKPAPEVAA
ncbi:MAG: twin-arginine translocase TatA/TatE family subunit [Bacillota bacterium]